MKTRILTALTILLTLPALADAKVTTERNAGADATAQFKFKSAPSPKKEASKYKLSLLDGARDSNGGDLDKLTDGKLPTEEDQPAENFFFDAGTPGGRLLLDLNSVTDVKQINTYSWHPTTRGPQVYKLYAADGQGENFKAKPAAGEETKSGWKLLASVDTRPKEGEGGGQYAVSVADAAGAALGKFRYLLFDVQRTESDDEFGNTFYSEIDVVPADAAAPPAAGAAKVAISTTGPATTRPGDKAYEIVIDYSETPDLKDWVETKLRPTLELWYPKIVQMLPSDGYTCTKKMTVTFKKEMQGVAFTSGGSRIVCAYPWYIKNLQGEAVGSVVHELVHVAQNYGYGRVRGGQGGRSPTWLVEGVADYIRWHKYEPAEKRRKIRPTAKYTDSYHVTAAFLEYVATNVDHEIVVKMNAAMREGRYNADLWKEYTGSTVDDLWAQYAKALQK